QRLTDDHATVGTVHLASGESIDFTHCILATGMEANRPQIREYPDALPVYDFGDAEWILARVEEATQPLNVGVLGSGYLGMEVATSAVAAGHRATVYLRGGEPLRKQLSAPVRQVLFEAHKAAGVEFVTHTSTPDDIAANIHDLSITSVGVPGSGYLGMEVGTSAVAAGHRATVYLRGGQPLRKQLSAPGRQALFEAHKAAGVEFVTHTSSPDDIDANIHDLFITSVGARPRLIPIDGDRPAEAWEVNESLATSHPGIFAAGDCAIVTAGPYALDHPWACEPVAESHGKFLAAYLTTTADDPSDAGEDTPADNP